MEPSETSECTYGSGPVHLLFLNAEGKWEVSQDAIDTLQQIKQPVASVAIVGELNY